MTNNDAAPTRRPHPPTDPSHTLPVAVIGAGPIRLAAAAHLLRRGAEVVVLEAGPAAGAHVEAWAHVRVFSPWRYNVDPVAREMLQEAGWREPDLDHLPTGAELVRDYLAPLAALPAIASRLRLRSRVLAVSRRGMDKLATPGRDTATIEIWDNGRPRGIGMLFRSFIESACYEQAEVRCTDCHNPHGTASPSLLVKSEIARKQLIEDTPIAQPHGEVHISPRARVQSAQQGPALAGDFLVEMAIQKLPLPYGVLSRRGLHAETVVLAVFP